MGTTWFIEGDIKGCFDQLDHQILLDILAESFDDGRFLRLIRELLHAGYLEDWKYHATLSGAPQGGIISPILPNVYLSKLDKYIEGVLAPLYTRGTKRQYNEAYHALLNKAARLRRKGAYQEAAVAKAQAQRLPSVDTTDPNYRRLKYVRYADDRLIGFIGPKKEAEEIKQRIKEYLHDVLKLELSEEKTLITHARTQAARFLGYDISTIQEDTYHLKGKRDLNGQVKLRIPTDILETRCQHYLRDGKPIQRAELLADTPYSIMPHYQAEYRGLVQYYQLANNMREFGRLKWIGNIAHQDAGNQIKNVSIAGTREIQSHHHDKQTHL
jgi:hypothetical protein